MVDWEKLEHAYGTAENVPALLDVIAGGDEDKAVAAVWELADFVNHQGSVYEASAPVAEFALRTVAGRPPAVRAALLRLVAGMCRGPEYDRLDVDLLTGDGRPPYEWTGGNPTVHAVRAVALSQVDRIAAHLADPDPAVRHQAAYLLATCEALAGRLLPRLHAASAAEADPGVRASLILAVAELSALSGATAATGRLAAVEADRSSPAAVRLAAALGHRWFTGLSLTPQGLDAYLAALEPDAAAEFLKVAWCDAPGPADRLVVWLSWRIRPEDPLAVEFALRSLASPHEAVRTAAIGPALRRSSEVDEPAGRRLIEAVGALLREPGPARAEAVRTLSTVGRATALVADDLAAALDDPDPGTVAWAATCLAHCGDARAVPALSRLLAAPDCPWTDGGFDRDASGLLRGLRPHGRELAAAITARLTSRSRRGWGDITKGLIRDLGEWGPDAAGFTDAILVCLEREACVPGDAARTLGRIGPLAASAADVLARLAKDDERHGPAVCAAWAHWRVTGEKDLALAVLGPRAADGDRDAMDALGDLGPAAAEYGPAIARRLADAYEWNRVHAAWALWGITGDPEPAVSVLTDMASRIGEYRLHDYAGTWSAERLGRIGPAAASAVPVLTAVLADERRARRAGLPRWGAAPDRTGREIIAEALDRIVPAA